MEENRGNGPQQPPVGQPQVTSNQPSAVGNSPQPETFAPPWAPPGSPTEVSPALPTHGRATASLVLGIISIVLSCLPIIGLVCGALAIVFYVQFMGLHRDAGGQLGGKGVAIGGLVCGIIGTVYGTFYILYWIFFGALIGSLGSIMGQAGGH